MSNSLRSSRALWLLAIAAVATLLLSTAFVQSASAHGSVANPISRNYGCWQRWGGDFQNPRMATEDPMCWQAWQTDTNAMWNWNGLYREGVAGNHQGAIPNGQLCSGGRTENGRYRAMDVPGAWRTTSVGNNFRLKFYDQASHGADYIRVYATRQGYDALTTPLAWSHLELVGQIGNTPASQWQQEPGGVSIEIPVNAPGRTGRHVIYTIWQASHSDQSYYICSDVQFGDGSTPPPTTPPPTTPPPTTPPPTTPPPTTAPPTTPPPAGACSATYRVTSTWSGGFQGEVQVTAGNAAIRGWRVTWTYASGQQVSQAWNATVSSSGSTV
ncbi:lytic polysaccharide monooxygenase auxiliary activity family 9 protein, partial [Micromonospora phaseoli]